ncbi:MAG: TetR/AcrR family transcriptional regulator [Alphaproteobacteria bacterium]|nr:TetR/AcrR family transcriptional regulator [Alphaproteobacteria bacterium]
MDKRHDMIVGAMSTFEAQGFRGTGVDAVLAPSGASTRTLYKHFGSRDGLVQAVLEQRHRDFMEQLGTARSDPVGELFSALERWLATHGSYGCMLLRARSEYAGANEAIVALVRRQKDDFNRKIACRIRAAIGRDDPELATQVWLLFEGATAAASVADLSVVGIARRAALALVKAAKVHAP